MSAQPSEEAKRLARAFARSVHDGYASQDDWAEAITAHALSAAETMRERCCRAVTRLYKNDDGYGGSTHDRTVHRCELAIRALPLEEA